jgi:primosomal protein N' (replication factor Y)
VVGTRGRGFAPVHDLGLVVIWDDGDDLHAEPAGAVPARPRDAAAARPSARAPRAGRRASRDRRGEQLSARAGRTSWASPREELRSRVTVSVAGAESTRWPATRWPGPHTGAHRGPPHDPRRAGDRAGAGADATGRVRRRAGLRALPDPGQVPGLLGPAGAGLGHRSADLPVVRHQPRGLACPECGHRGLRAPVVGETRTAEELGRTFAGTVVRTSGGDRVLASVDDESAIVVATPGAEPVAAGGYAAVVLLDTWLAPRLAHLRAEEEALRRWSNAVGLVRPAAARWRSATRPTRRSRRWSAGTRRASRRARRRAARGPPAAGVPAGDDHRRARRRRRRAHPAAPPDGPRCSARCRRPTGSRGRGPGPARHGRRAVPALGELQRLRSARKLDAVRIQVDPPTL